MDFLINYTRDCLEFENFIKAGNEMRARECFEKLLEKRLYFNFNLEERESKPIENKVKEPSIVEVIPKMNEIKIKQECNICHSIL